MQNLKKNWLEICKMTWGIWQVFTRALESLKLGTLMGSFYPKYNLTWGMMRNLNRNWFAISKLIWEIWRILTRALKRLKNAHFNGLLLNKLYDFLSQNSTDEFCFMILKRDAKPEEKITLSEKCPYGIQSISP